MAVLLGKRDFVLGDVILEVDKSPVANLGDYNKVMSRLEPGKKYLFLVKKRQKHHLHRLRRQKETVAADM